MNQIPENTPTAVGEGHDLFSAIENAAEQLGLKRHQVAHKIDLTHFRSQTGSSLPKTTVKVEVWARPDGEASPERRAPKPEITESREEPAAPAEPASSTEGSEHAVRWFSELLGFMNIKGKVEGSGTADRIHLNVTADQAGRIIGKRGSTLSSIRHLLSLSLEGHGNPTLDVDVDDDRPRSGDREGRRGRDGGGRDRGRGRDRDRDRGRDGGRGRGRDGDRGRGRGRDRDRGRGRSRARDDDRGREEPASRYPADKLEAVAERAAQKAFDTNRAITINLELGNVGEFDGLSQFGRVSTVTPNYQDGYTSGWLSSLSVSRDGTLVGLFSNGLRRNLAAVSLATFQNPAGLQSVGNNYFESSPNSGVAVATKALSGGAGEVRGGSLEKSNVDTAIEFVNLMQAQNGFQANARTIKTANDMLRELTDLIR